MFLSVFRSKYKIVEFDYLGAKVYAIKKGYFSPIYYDFHYGGFARLCEYCLSSDLKLVLKKYSTFTEPGWKATEKSANITELERIISE